MLKIKVIIISLFMLGSWSWAKNPGLSPFQQIIVDSIRSSLKENKIRAKFSLTLYSHKKKKFDIHWNSNEWFTPASTLKTIVTAAAIHHFPKNHFITTAIQFKGELKDKKFTGNIEVRGAGDPNISGRFFGNEGEVLARWAEFLKSKGILEIQGKIVFKDDFFKGPKRPKEWKRNYFNRWYGAEITPLSFNDNCYTLEMNPGDSLGDTSIVTTIPEFANVVVNNEVTTSKGIRSRIKFDIHPDSNKVSFRGSMGIEAKPNKYTLPIRYPDDFFETAFKYYLKANGVKYRQKKLDSNYYSPIDTILHFKTVPTVNIIEEINQRSQNLHAELLLRNLGKSVYEIGSRENGLKAEMDFIKSLGISQKDFQLYDGSGLAPKNKLKPHSLVKLLYKMARHPSGSDYIQSLATPGLHGYKAKRLSHLGKKVKIKTGFINSVQGLVGYIFVPGVDTISFAIYLNGYKIPDKKATKFVDSTITFLTNWYNRDEPSINAAKKLLADPDNPKNYKERLIYFSKQLIEIPYSLGPTGEGRYGMIDGKPLIQLKGFDCVTYIEHVMALSKTKNVKSLISNLNTIRYLNSKPSYQNRKHFFIEDWVKQSPELVKVLRFPGDTTYSKISDKKKFYNFKKIKFKKKNPRTELSYVPYEKALEMMANWNFGKKFLGVGFITKIPWLWVTHTGFLDATNSDENGKITPVLRHASSKTKKVTEENFTDYLKRRKKYCIGVVFFEFEDQSIL